MLNRLRRLLLAATRTGFEPENRYARTHLLARLEELAALRHPKWPKQKLRRAARIAASLMLHEMASGAYTFARSDLIVAARLLAADGARDPAAASLAERTGVR